MLRRVYPCMSDERDVLRVDNEFDSHPNCDTVSLKTVMKDAQTTKQIIYLSVGDVQALRDQLDKALENYREGR